MGLVDILHYRDFWDIPHCVVFASDAGPVYLESLFRDDFDDYDPFYTVYLLPLLEPQALSGSWAGLASRALQRLGRIRLERVRFDPTRRKQIDNDFLYDLDPRSSST